MTSSQAGHGPLPRTAAPRHTGSIRLSDPAGVVAAVPYLLGHHPSRSLVVVGLRDGGRVGPVLRLDLPTGTTGTVVADQALDALLGNGCERAVVTLHVDVDPPEHPGEEALRLVDALRRGVDLLDVVHVGPRRYRSVSCPDSACCPAEGAEVSVLHHHPVAAGFVLAGRTPAATRELLETPATVDPDEALEALGAATAWRARSPSAQQRRRLLRQWVETVAGPHPRSLAPDLAGRLAAQWTDDVQLRDACGLACLPGGPAAAGRLLRDTTEGTSLLQQVLSDPGCAGTLTEVSWAFRRLSALAPQADRAGVDACHAWLAWVSGSGTVAGVLAGRVLATVPDHGLALLVSQCLDRAVGPPWTREDG